MLQSYSEKLAAKIVALFDQATLDHDAISNVAFWVKYNANVVVLAKIVHFCERILHDDTDR